MLIKKKTPFKRCAPSLKNLRVATEPTIEYHCADNINKSSMCHTRIVCSFGLPLIGTFKMWDRGYPNVNSVGTSLQFS